MKTVSIHDAKTNLSKYIEAAKKGEKIYIGGFGKAEVELVKIKAEAGERAPKRNFSIAKGKVTENSESFSPDTERITADLMFGA